MTGRAGSGAFAEIDSMLADLLCLPTKENPERESRRGKLSHRVVRGADKFVESSGVLAEVQRWEAEDHPDRNNSKGGRPTVYDDRFRLVLTVLFALVFTGEDPLISRISEAVTGRLHTKSRDPPPCARVRVPGPPSDRDGGGQQHAQDQRLAQEAARAGDCAHHAAARQEKATDGLQSHRPPASAPPYAVPA